MNNKNLFKRLLTSFIAFFLFFSSTRTMAQVTPSDYFTLSNNLTKEAIHKVITTRCLRYLSQSSYHQCSLSTYKLLEALDFDVIFLTRAEKLLLSASWDPQAFLFIAFKKDLIRLLNLDKTRTYLERLNSLLNQYLTGEIPHFNLWHFTLNFYGTREASAEVLASLFQDTSYRKLHLYYLEKTLQRPQAKFLSNVELLSRIIDTFNFVIDTKKQSSFFDKEITAIFYPPEKYSLNLNQNIYHFYVPFFLAQKMLSQGFSQKTAYLAPLMLTLTYEFITFSSSYTYLIDDPLNITSHHKIQDIYAGHSGASLGAYQEKSIKSFARLKSYFNVSTFSGVTYLLNEDNSRNQWFIGMNRPLSSGSFISR